MDDKQDPNTLRTWSTTRVVDDCALIDAAAKSLMDDIVRDIAATIEEHLPIYKSSGHSVPTRLR